MSNQSPALPLRTVLKKRYFIGKLLGAGGFGMTYKALDLTTGIIVAVKEFFPKGYTKRTYQSTLVRVSHETQQSAFQHWLAAFVKEARILSTVKHLHGVVKMLDFFQENDTAYIVTDFLDGMPLRGYINSLGGRLKWKDAVNILRPVFDSLYILHENGIIHKDISPENIMVVKNAYVKLIDFGAASIYKSPVDQPYVVLKTGYSPLELYSNKYPKGPWTDIYQMGATLFNAITGDVPPEAHKREALDLLKKPSYYGLDIPPIIDNTIMKSLKLKPQDRYQSILPFIQVLYGEVLPKFNAPPPGINK